MVTSTGQTGDDLHAAADPPDHDEVIYRDTPHRPGCNVPGCEGERGRGGLCDDHWWTHRGLADVDEQAGVEQGAEVTAP